MSRKILHGPDDLEPFAGELPRLGDALSRRINTDQEGLERGLAQLVLTIIELLRQLMERQALRRIDGGALSDEEVERLGSTFMELDKRMEQLRVEFGLEEKDLNLNLGPLGNLL
jgi:hypothetical protein